jgi:hypothetical protein
MMGCAGNTATKNGAAIARGAIVLNCGSTDQNFTVMPV